MQVAARAQWLVAGGVVWHLRWVAPTPCLVRLDTGDTLNVPLDLSIYGVDDIAWQPNSSAIAIIARRQSRSVMVSRVMRQQFNDMLAV